MSFQNEIFQSGSSTTMPYAGFLDADSLPDIVLSYSTFNRSSVYLNNGNFNFTEAVLEDHFNHDTPIMNLDNFGTDDIGLVSFDVNNINLFKYIGNEQFELQTDFYATGTYKIAGFLAADFNQDGFDDFAITRCSWTDCTDSIYIYLNNHDWSFNKPQQYFVGTLNRFISYSADFNGDSFPDIYMKGYSENSTIKILWNDGFGFFSYENHVKIKEKVLNPISLNVFPNPFFSDIRIEIHLTEPEDVEINIKDLYGNLLKNFKLRNIAITNGYSFLWNGRDETGNPYPPGVYIITASVNNYQVANKVIKLK